MWEGSDEVTIKATPARVWAVVADVGRHAELAGSGEIAQIRVAGPVGLGTTWEADIRVPRLDEPFVALSEVVVFDPPRELCWTSVPPPLVDGEPESSPLVRWWFRLWPTEDGTLVKHAFRVAEPKVGGEDLREFFEATNRVDSILAGMRKTLANLTAAAEA